MIMQDRYYVQTLTTHIFLIRERVSADKERDPDDRLVKSFDLHHDAVLYANTVNEEQRKLDERYGLWTQSAI